MLYVFHLYALSTAYEMAKHTQGCRVHGRGMIAYGSIRLYTRMSVVTAYGRQQMKQM